MKVWNRGSFTVEAAGVMGAVLLVIFALVYGNFYVHNKNWLKAAALEAALTGSMEEAQEEGTGYGAAADRAEALGNTGFFSLHDLEVRVSSGKTVQVVYSGEMSAAFGGLNAEFQSEGSCRVIQPVSFIRNFRLVKELGQAVKGE